MLRRTFLPKDCGLSVKVGVALRATILVWRKRSLFGESDGSGYLIV